MASKAKKKPVTIAPQMAWDILWRNYIAALRKPTTPANLDKVERLKLQIDAFDQRWLGLEPRPVHLEKCHSCGLELPPGAPPSVHGQGCTAFRKR